MGRINQLAEKTTLNSTDVIAVDAGAGGNTNKMTGANLAGQLKTLGNYQEKLTFDSAPTAGSTNPVTSGGVKTALDGKQNTLTFDATPTAGSTNPVTSGGIATAISQSTAISTITFTSASGVSSNLFIRKSGNVVSINGYLTATNAFPASEYQLGTIPAGSRPGAAIRTAVAVGEAAYIYRNSAYLLVDTSGKIYITAQTGNTYKVCYFSISYIAEA